MAQVVSAPPSPDVPPMGLGSRIVDVILAPRDAYTAVAARPRAAGVLTVVLAVMIAAQFTFLSTDIGKTAALTQQINTMKGFGVNVTDEMVTRMESQLRYAPYTAAASLLVFGPLMVAAVSGLLLAVFTAVLGGGAAYRQVFAVVAHSYVIAALQQVFSLPINYARGDMASPTKLAVFFPTISDTGFVYYLLSAVDLFYVWSCISLAIGLAVLYHRRTGPVAAVLFGIYAVVALLIATIRTFA